MRSDRGLRWFDTVLTGTMVILGLVAVVFGLTLVLGPGEMTLPAEVARPYEVTFPGGRVVEVAEDGSAPSPGDVSYLAKAPRVLVEASIDEDDLDGRLALGAELAVVGVLAGAALVQLRRVVRSARRGDPFEAANVDRIRRVAYIVFALPIVLRAGTWVVDAALDSDIDLRVRSLGGDIWTSLFVGLGLLALAQVFREGVALRELERGTV